MRRPPPKRSRGGAGGGPSTGRDGAAIALLGGGHDESGGGGSGSSSRRQLSIRTFFRVAAPQQQIRSSTGLNHHHRRNCNKRRLSSVNGPGGKTTTITPTPPTPATRPATACSPDDELSPTDEEARRAPANGDTNLIIIRSERRAPREEEEDESRDQAPEPRAETSNKKHRQRQRHSSASAASSFQQLYLDFGQRDFAKRTVCDVCGMMYVHGVDEDLKQHRRVCRDFTDGVPFQQQQQQDPANNVRTVTRFGEDTSICEVRSSDGLKLRKKVAQVRAIVDQELGFARSQKPEDHLTTYLYISKKRVVGLASAESIREGYRLESNYDRSTVGRKAVVGIHQIWVHSEFRGKGIATRLLDTIREKRVFNFVVPSHQLAFSSPTEAGIALAKSYVKKNSSPSSDQVLVYDCR